MFSSLDSYSHKEDASAFPGKRALISFLSWFDYCDQLIKEAQKVWNVFRWYKCIQQISSSSCFPASFWDTPFSTFVSDDCCCYGKSCAGAILHWCYGTSADANVSSSYKTQQSRVWIKLIFGGWESSPYLTWKCFIQFRDWNPHVNCTVAPHCSSGDFGCAAAGAGVFYPWREQGARNTDRHQQASLATQADRALWSHFWWGEGGVTQGCAGWFGTAGRL